LFTSSIAYKPVGQQPTVAELRVDVHEISEAFESIRKPISAITTQAEKVELSERVNALLRQMNTQAKNYEKVVKKDSCFFCLDACNPYRIFYRILL
jgi:succinate dehydrogenase/fumarate reductase-like Fe-S protein